MDFNIILFEGTDTIKFGMTHEEVRAILQKEPQLFKKLEVDLYMTENYADICHVFYDNSTCAAFEFFMPSQVFYKDTPLLGQKRKDVEDLFRNLDGYESLSDGFNVLNKDLAFYSPSDIIESVYISRKGYSEEQFAYYMKVL